MKWIRLWIEDTLRGTTFKELDYAERGIWFSLLLMAGEGRNPGVVEIRDGEAWSMEGLAEYIKCPVDVLKVNLQKLTNVNKIIVENDNRIVIKNWGKYQTSYRKEAYLKQNLTTEEEVEVDVDIKKEQYYGRSFLLFWIAYPRKIGKVMAFGEWKKINPNGILIQKIMSTLKAQKESAQWKEQNEKYIPYPSTWLHQRRWEDEIESEKKSW